MKNETSCCILFFGVLLKETAQQFNCVLLILGVILNMKGFFVIAVSETDIAKLSVKSCAQ